MTTAKNGFVDIELERSTGFRLDVAFEVPASGITVLFGPSGCGKTTVLRSVAGLERPKGRVAINGECWQDDDRKVFVPTYKRRLGYVFQEASLFEHLDVEKNLTFGLKRSGNQEGLGRLKEAVELLGIGHLLVRRVSELSGGERQRVAIARALVMTPDIILMDEPLAALDWQRKQEILPWLERLRDELEVPILYVTHSIDEMARLADYVVVFKAGSIVRHGTLEEVIPYCRNGDEAEGGAVVLTGEIEERFERWGAIRIRGEDFTMEMPDLDEKPVGERVRVRIKAADVSITKTEPGLTSIRNVFECTVGTISPLGPSYVLVRLEFGGSFLLARVTRHSLEELFLKEGDRVWAQVKAGSIVI